MVCWAIFREKLAFMNNSIWQSWEYFQWHPLEPGLKMAVSGEIRGLLRPEARSSNENQGQPEHDSQLGRFQQNRPPRRGQRKSQQIIPRKWRCWVIGLYSVIVCSFYILFLIVNSLQSNWLFFFSCLTFQVADRKQWKKGVLTSIQGICIQLFVCCLLTSDYPTFTLQQDEVDEEYDTTIQGPWMFKWEMIHMNRHTEKLKNEETTWHKNWSPNDKSILLQILCLVQ